MRKSDEDQKPIDIHQFMDEKLAEHFEEEREERLELEQTEEEREFDDARKHVPYTTEFDKVHEYKETYSDYQAIKQKVRPQALKLALELDRILVAKENRRVLMEQERGILNRKALTRLAVDKNYRTPFKIRVREETRKVAIQLVIDMSGSMEGSKIITAKLLAATFAEALTSLDIDFEVGGFHTYTIPHPVDVDSLSIFQPGI
jgi:cobalamin biosynthesis protein CobT